MPDTSSKFRFGNLVVNLAEGLKKCRFNSIEPICNKYNTKFVGCPANSCAWIRTTYLNCKFTEAECNLSEIACLGSVELEIDKVTIFINNVIPQITEHEEITQLKADLKVAVDMAEKQEATLAAAAKPQTVEEVNVLRENLKLALKEVDELKSQMEKKK